ncbi:methyl-accepting chemotaxis protein [Magnetospirillum fulvum]|uniref:Chemotaxis sensory transducer n=1 Tax=Magnetospirillum fulvum MGU-K5 TaxID=1316936 RepID=S9SGL2_MAGFU|nr:methyl-accepting chemotaxis protein [Magnetospirillum fulvum]EPY03233.1 Chemotaxis sensory transducer [Magnetospirillum fulvum MGU-K5]
MTKGRGIAVLATLVPVAVLAGEGVLWALPGLGAGAAVLLRLVFAVVGLVPLVLFVVRSSAAAPVVAQSAVATSREPALVPEPVFDSFRCGVCIAEKIKYFGDFSGLMEKETSEVIQDTETNALSLMNGLKEVESGLRRLLDYISTSGSDSRATRIIERTEAQLERCHSLIEEFATERQQDIQMVQSQVDDVGRVVSSLSETVGTVRGIARQTRMLALNAMIEAVRAGSAGQGFAVVADEVRSLSQQSDQAAVAIGEGIANLERAVSESLQSIVNERIAKEERGFGVIAGAVTELTQNLQILVSQQSDTLAKVQQENENLSQPIMRMIGSIQFQDVVKRRLTGLSTCFKEISQGIEETVIEMSDPSSISHEDVNARYRGRLDAMVQQALSRLEAEPSETGGTAIELF